MKIKTGCYVHVKPTTCKAQGLTVGHPYRVIHFHDVPPSPVRMKNGLWFPPHPILIDAGEDFPKRLHVEDVAPVPDEVRLAPKPKRHPVDRVAVLLRLRRDYCLKYGRYPTIDLEVRKEAREAARRLFLSDIAELRSRSRSSLAETVCVVHDTMILEHLADQADEAKKPGFFLKKLMEEYEKYAKKGDLVAFDLETIRPKGPPLSKG